MDFCPDCATPLVSYHSGEYIEKICWNCGHYESDSPAYREHPNLFANMVRENPMQFIDEFLKKPSDESLQHKKSANKFTVPVSAMLINTLIMIR